jgi:twitching motility protein PilT
MPLDLRALLVQAKQQGASDLHLSSGQPPLLRLHGAMTKLQMPPVTAEELKESLFGLISAESRKTFESRLDLDFGLEIPGVARFRANLFMQRRGPGAVFRLIPNKIMTLEDLNLPKVLKTLCSKEKGLVVVTGPTGSGKSTTLAAMVDHVNESRSAHIITIEDPIEFVHESKRCLINQREVGRDTVSFATALRAALREDPDIILVGELRDLETTSLAISAAETGHLVFATLHTNSAAKTIDRIIDIYPGDQQQQVRTMLSESLLAVVAQTLVPTAAGNGRVAAIEILIGVPAIRHLIREDKVAQIQSMIQTGSQFGMQTLDQCLKELANTKVITKEEALIKSGNPNLFDIGAPTAATPSKVVPMAGNPQRRSG